MSQRRQMLPVHVNLGVLQPSIFKWQIVVFTVIPSTLNLAAKCKNRGGVCRQ